MNVIRVLETYQFFWKVLKAALKEGKDQAKIKYDLAPDLNQE